MSFQLICIAPTTRMLTTLWQRYCRIQCMWKYAYWRGKIRISPLFWIAAGPLVPHIPQVNLSGTCWLMGKHVAWVITSVPLTWLWRIPLIFVRNLSLCLYKVSLCTRPLPDNTGSYWPLFWSAVSNSLQALRYEDVYLYWQGLTNPSKGTGIHL